MSSRRLSFGLCCLLSLLLFFAPSCIADTLTIQIIAFNDFHGYLQSPGKFRADSQSPEVPVGGADMLAGYVLDLREQNRHAVVVAAGDLIGASPLVSALFHDEPTIEILNRLGLEFSSVGNHEFDKGRQELQRIQSGGCSTKDANTCKGAQIATPVPFEGASFQYLAANVLDQATGQPIFPAYATKTFGGVSIAFIGLTLKATPTMVTPSGVAGLRFADEAPTINSLVHELEAKGIHTFVVLIHQGGQQTGKTPVNINACAGDLDGSPVRAIVSQLDDAVDLVISGHTHQAYICRIPNRSGRPIPVTSASSYGRLVTDIDITLDTDTKKAVAVSARNILVDRTNASISPHATIKGMVDRYAALAAPLANRVVGRVTADVTTAVTPAGESALGNLIADAQLEATRDSGHAVIAFMNSGGIRADLPFSPTATGLADGQVTYGELFSAQPFGNSLVTMTLTGAQLKILLEEQFKGCTLDFPPGKNLGRVGNQILQVSEGFTYTWNPAGTACEKVDPASIKINGVEVVPAQRYRVTTNSFLVDGGDQLYEFTRGTDRVGGPQDIDALAAYFAAHPSVSPNQVERIKSTLSANP